MQTQCVTYVMLIRGKQEKKARYCLAYNRQWQHSANAQKRVSVEASEQANTSVIISISVFAITYTHIRRLSSHAFSAVRRELLNIRFVSFNFNYDDDVRCRQHTSYQL